MKNKKAMDLREGVIVFIIFALLFAGILFVVSGRFIFKNVGLTTTLERKTSQDSCAAISSRPELPGFGNNEQKLNLPRYNRDDDFHLDSCDICLGTGGQKDNGHNLNDRDTDYIPDDCDLNPDKADKSLACFQYVHKLNGEGEPEFIKQCATISYCNALEDFNQEAGIGTEIKVCSNKIEN